MPFPFLAQNHWTATLYSVATSLVLGLRSRGLASMALKVNGGEWSHPKICQSTPDPRFVSMTRRISFSLASFMDVFMDALHYGGHVTGHFWQRGWIIFDTAVGWSQQTVSFSHTVTPCHVCILLSAGLTPMLPPPPTSCLSHGMQSQ